MNASEAMIKTIRDKMKTDQAFYKNRPRYALFSFMPGAPSDANEERTFGKSHERKKNASIDAKNMSIGKCDLFSKSGYLFESAPFVDTNKIKTFRSDDGKTASKFHTKPFKAAGPNSTEAKAPYSHIPNPPKPSAIVGFGKKGFYTSGPKQGLGERTIGHLFNKHPEHSNDPYERNRSLSNGRQSDTKQQTKRKPFLPSNPANSSFMKSRDMFGTEGNLAIKSLATSPKESKKEKAFFPSSPAKIGFNRTINKFPAYIEDPLPVIVQKKTANSQKELPWRRTFFDNTGPSASVQQYNTRYRPTGRC